MNEKIESYWALSPQRFKFLESFELRRFVDDNSAEAYQLTLTLLAEPRSESARGRFTFSGVQELVVGRLDGLLGLMIEVFDVRDHQLEGLRFRVVDSEHGVIGFWCRDFELNILPGPA